MPFAGNAEIYGENEAADYLYKVVSGWYAPTRFLTMAVVRSAALSAG